MPVVEEVKLDGLYNLRFTYGSGYRFPSIKELYYKWEGHSPAIYGSDDLKASESDYYSISIDKNTYFTNVWGTYMLRVCLGNLKNLPQYAYELCAYKKTCIAIS